MAVAGVDWRDGRIVDPKISLSVWEDYVPPKGAVVAKTRAAFQPDGAVVLWDTRDWIIRQVLEGGALRLAFHPSGKCLATVSVDGSVLVWDHVTGEMLFDLRIARIDGQGRRVRSDGTLPCRWRRRRRPSSLGLQVVAARERRRTRRFVADARIRSGRPAHRRLQQRCRRGTAVQRSVGVTSRWHDASRPTKLRPVLFRF